MKNMILFVLMLLSSHAFAGGDVGNGGGFAKCGSTFYQYDFLLTNQMNSDGVNLSFQSLAPVISQQLRRFNDPLARDFDLFVNEMFTQTSGNPYQWFVRSNLGLMYEPGMTLPSQCTQRKQAVYYFAPGGVPYATYAYDPAVISLVQGQPNGNLQISYLWMHEWLWNHFSRNDFMALARFNQLLHSSGLASMSTTEYNSIRPHELK